MYHDQALIPLKALDFDGGVNITLGLPFVRTSPDHGTALDIAGSGRASEASLVAAIVPRPRHCREAHPSARHERRRRARRACAAADSRGDPAPRALGEALARAAFPARSEPDGADCPRRRRPIDGLGDRGRPGAGRLDPRPACGRRPRGVRDREGPSLRRGAGRARRRLSGSPIHRGGGCARARPRRSHAAAAADRRQSALQHSDAVAAPLAASASTPSMG